MRKAKNITQAWDLEINTKASAHNEPRAIINWKATNVCMDVYCKCGTRFHIDSDFCYAVQCPKCATFYACGSRIELIELEENPGNFCTDNHWVDYDKL